MKQEEWARQGRLRSSAAGRGGSAGSVRSAPLRALAVQSRHIRDADARLVLTAEYRAGLPGRPSPCCASSCAYCGCEVTARGMGPGAHLGPDPTPLSLRVEGTGPAPRPVGRLPTRRRSGNSAPPPSATRTGLVCATQGPQRPEARRGEAVGFVRRRRHVAADPPLTDAGAPALLVPGRSPPPAPSKGDRPPRGRARG